MESKSVKSKVQEKNRESKSAYEDALEKAKRELSQVREREAVLTDGISTLERLIAKEREAAQAGA